MTATVEGVDRCRTVSYCYRNVKYCLMKNATLRQIAGFCLGGAAPELRSRRRGTEAHGARRIHADQRAGDRSGTAAVRSNQPPGLADHGGRIHAGAYPAGVVGHARCRRFGGALSRPANRAARCRAWSAPPSISCRGCWRSFGRSIRASRSGCRSPTIANRSCTLMQEGDIELAIMGRPPEGWPTRAEPFAMHPHVLVTSIDHRFTRMEIVPARALGGGGLHRARTSLGYPRRLR